MPTLYEFGPNYQLRATHIPEDPQAPLLARIAALEEALKPFAAFYEAWAATKYPEHLEADIDTSAIATQRFTEAGDFVNTRITYADLHRARAVLQQAVRSSPMNGEQKGRDQG